MTAADGEDQWLVAAYACTSVEEIYKALALRDSARMAAAREYVPDDHVEDTATTRPPPRKSGTRKRA